MARDLSIDSVYFAIPSAGGDVVREITAAVSRAGVELAIIPRTYRIVARERVSVADLTDVDVLDFVGRAPVKHDMDQARELIRGKRVLVTGAAGSIGSRVVAQLHVLEPELVVCVDRSEPGIFHLGQSLGQAPGRPLEIADVQSEERIGQLMDRYQPDFVFHVAAYKHVPLMQDNPLEAFNNNVWGTLNVMRQAARVGAERAVYVSTDKAVHPTNIMGATKRLGELILADLGATSESTRFSGVRFGNVLESEGSVMQTFRRQLQAHKSLTVTHPDITRYFMTIDEAAQLVIQTATTGRHGELFVLDMGEPIRIHDLARSLIDAVEPGLDIDIVGLRPGEKMYEELSYASDTVDATTHPKIFIVREEREHRPGETLAWVDRMLSRTRAYDMSNAELRRELIDFGFAALQ
ncbi:polysaccharide biosynthesis protein [Microbacterium sp. Root166]|uniref:polysaccharide biosynthesis protein n=1 Tax=Microbacterium sp. Root166 TaxID=1736478 RepID=UPI001F2E829E|nr:polysaccharide biosynthesis protein [Microbacterium sp. Root166]